MEHSSKNVEQNIKLKCVVVELNIQLFRFHAKITF